MSILTEAKSRSTNLYIYISGVRAEEARLTLAGYLVFEQFELAWRELGDVKLREILFE